MFVEVYRILEIWVVQPKKGPHFLKEGFLAPRGLKTFDPPPLMNIHRFIHKTSFAALVPFSF